MIAAAILAAGASSRMGRTKALLPLGTECFVTRLVRTLHAAGLTEVLVVAGPEAQEAIGARVDQEGLQVRLVVNPDPSRGQLSSLHCALAVADRPGVGGLLAIPVDVPLVSAATVAAVLRAHAATKAPVVRPGRNGQHGHPVLFDRAVFDELRAADLRAGARTVVRAHLEESVDVPVEDDGAFEDADTPEDYERIRARAVRLNKGEAPQ